MESPDERDGQMREYEDCGEEIPDDLFPPDLLPGAEDLLAAFWSLSGDRSLGFGAVGRISFIAIDRYANRFGFDDPDEFTLLERAVRICDAEWIRHLPKHGQEEEESEDDADLPPISTGLVKALFGRTS